MSIRNAKKLVEEIELLSLDIFDTLLFRTVANPTDIFNKIWMNGVKNSEKIKKVSSNEFKILRIEAEQKARNLNRKVMKTSEVSLEEIYKQMPNIFKNDIRLLANLEIEAEKENCYINEEIYELIKLAKSEGKKVVLTSDMYLSRSELNTILSFNGFEISLIDEIFVSSEYLVSKSEGILFEVLLDNFKTIEANKILHIGDNKLSDYEKPKKYGIRSILYDVIPKKKYDVFHYEKIIHNSPLKQIESLRRLALSKYNGIEEDKKIAFQLGASIIGPFLVFFIDWAVRRMENENIQKIFPLMREGKLLTMLLNNEIKDRNLSLEVKTIYVSRKSTYIPSIKNLNVEIVEDIMEIKNLNVDNLFKMLGFTYIPLVFKKYGSIMIKDTRLIKFGNSTLRTVILEYLLSEQIKSKVEEYINNQRKLLTEYLKQEMGTFHNVATIDIGFKGTIQSAIDKSLLNNGVSSKITHFIAMGSEEVEKKLFDNINIQGFIGTFNENLNLIKGIMRSPDVLEQLIIASIGSTIGYGKNEGKVRPKLGEYNNSNSEFKKYCWQGIFEFQKLWFEFRKRKQCISNEVINSKKEIIMILHRLIAMPTFDEVRYIGNLKYDDNFGSNNVCSICDNNDQQIIKEKGLDYADNIISYGWRYLNVLWPQAAITKINKNYYIKKYLELNNFDEYFSAMRKVVEEIKLQDLDEVIVYGAGEVGERLIEVCKLYDIKVLYIVDRKESLWGRLKQGIKIISLDEAILEHGCCNFAIGSLAFIDEIRESILQKLDIINGEAKIFSVM